MYQVKIVLKETLTPEEQIKTIKEVNSVFSNRGGTVKNTGSSNVCIFEGETEDVYAILNEGVFLLEGNKELLDKMKIFDWIEDDEYECENMFEVFNMKVY